MVPWVVWLSPATRRCLRRDLGPHVVHVEARMPSMTFPSPAGGSAPACAVDEDPSRKASDRRDRRDLGGAGERLLGLGVDPAEDDVLVLPPAAS